MIIRSRAICWPDPDATCLQGGCVYCNDHPLRSVSQIRAYAQRSGPLPHRSGIGTMPAMEAFQWGQDRGWPHVETDKS